MGFLRKYSLPKLASVEVEATIEEIKSPRSHPTGKDQAKIVSGEFNQNFGN